MSDDLMTSTSAAKHLGVAVSTLKRWADEGRVRCVRTPGGHRRFRIQDLPNFEVVDDKLAVSNPLADLLLSDRGPHATRGALLELRDRSGSWAAAGPEIGAALAALGDMWINGRISVHEEHHASERLSRALSWCSDTISVATNAPQCLLVVPPSELHTLGLSLLEPCLLERGWRTRWVGKRTPTVEVVRCLRDRHPGAIAASASVVSEARQLADFVDAVQPVAAEVGAILLLGGSGPWPRPANSLSSLPRAAPSRASVRSTAAG